MITIILTIVVIIALGLLQYFSQKRPPNFPPGPRGLPLLGYLPFLRFPLYKTFESLSRKYGNICGFYLLNFPVIVLGDTNALKEWFGNDQMLARPNLKITDYFSHGDGNQRGITLTSGKVWQAQRRFAFKNLRDFGLGTKMMDSLIINEIKELTNGLKKVLNRPIDIQERLKMALFNSFWYIISGDKYTYDDPKLARIFGKIEQLLSTLSVGVLVMPWVSKAFPKLSGFESLIAVRNDAFELIQKAIEDHKTSLDMDNPRDFIDAYLREIALTTDPNSTFYKEEGEHHLLSVLFDLFFAAGAGTSFTLYWTVLYMMTHPNVQEKVHIEIDSIVGMDRNPSLSDRPRMPYMTAVIAETLRHSSLAPIGSPHSTTETLEFNGYTIPKNTFIIGNLKSMNHDKNYWGDPESFRPERFIDDGGHYKGSDGMYAFSLGKRMCPGENMARDEIFLFLVGLLQQFRFDVVDVNNPPTIEPKSEIAASLPRPYSVIIRDRQGRSYDFCALANFDFCALSSRK